MLCSRLHFLHANGFGLGTLAFASSLKQDGLLAGLVRPLAGYSPACARFVQLEPVFVY
ncbi:MAG: hypothetical protein JWO94_3030 [Verrucomicrobiaceae bacterium]|nr:hypothetical protein [Verrucomicrobiaceae bacterium]